MSLLKSLKAFFGSSDKDVIKNKPVEEKAPINNRKVDTNSKNKNFSTDKITEEKKKAKEKVSETTEEIKEKVSKSTENSEVNPSEKKEKKGDNMTLLEENLVIRPDSVNHEFTQLFVDAGIDTVEHCFQCGTCSGGCPSGRRTPYKIRQIVRKCLLGLKDEVISDPALWMCTTCYTCQERCPRSVKIVEIIKLARNEAAKAGFMAPAHRATGSFVIKTGHAVPINDATKILRKKVGLSELPPTTHSNPKALEDIRTIVEATGFDKLIGYNMETNELTE